MLQDYALKEFLGVVLCLNSLSFTDDLFHRVAAAEKKEMTSLYKSDLFLTSSMGVYRHEWGGLHLILC